MTGPRKVEVAGTGSYVPERVLTNFDLEKIVDTSDEWIQQRTGIQERRLIAEEDTNSDLATRAARRALDVAGMKPEDLGLIIVATVTPDHVFPATACITQAKLGAVNAGAYDLASACTGFVAALTSGWVQVASGVHEAVLVIGSECLSRIVDYTDRNTCVLFGDAAGAMVIRASEGNGAGHLLHTELFADGNGGDMMIVPAGCSKIPTTHESIDKRLHYMKLRGREVFKFAVTKFSDLIESAMEALDVTQDEVGLVVPHQVNIRIIEAAAKRLKFPMEKIYTNLDRFGNTSAASIPVALDEAVQRGKVSKGDLIILVAFGGGLTWGSCVFRI